MWDPLRPGGSQEQNLYVRLLCAKYSRSGVTGQGCGCDLIMVRTGVS